MKKRYLGLNKEQLKEKTKEEYDRRYRKKNSSINMNELFKVNDIKINHNHNLNHNLNHNNEIFNNVVDSTNNLGLNINENTDITRNNENNDNNDMKDVNDQENQKLDQKTNTTQDTNLEIQNKLRRDEEFFKEKESKFN